MAGYFCQPALDKKKQRFAQMGRSGDGENSLNQVNLRVDGLGAMYF
jgi:hypothetical protein